jgi:uncharacterized protein (TIGR00369 family)
MRATQPGASGASPAEHHAPARKTPAASEVTLNQLMMPEHSNGHGNVHGGIIMKLVDETAAIAAMRHAQRPVVTVAIDSMTFRQPVRVSDLVTCRARVTYVGTTSIEVSVLVTAENPITGETTHTNSAFLVFVALGEDNQKVPVPGLLPETEEDVRRLEEGRQRQEQRLARRGHRP